ncbi:MAG: prepilin-type N-terminal cleavage/methylation domain-containing protein [Candidatus Riflebacteria bacterium]|nr:prepilin-type N-terminal cleavage/methylation domain-containing protein [Candidatus Riflebacteria bacterium]
MKINVMKQNFGFTMVELVVAALVLSVFLTGGYMVYRSVLGTVKQTSWSLSAQQKARNGLDFARREMERASYFSRCTPSSINTIDLNYEFNLWPGAYKNPVDQMVASWAVCSPLSGGSTGFVMRCGLRYYAGRLMYYKTREQGPDLSENEVSGKILMDNVASLTVSKSQFGTGTGSQIIMEVELRDPEHIETKVHERIGAAIPVKLIAH